MKRSFFVFISFLFIVKCLGQTGPNLTVGVSEVLYNKGKLDSEIIAEIVATKRGEIKAELAKRLILDKFQCSSFATYYYVQKTLNLLLDETNKEVISKGLLENSAEMLMVYGFAEFYLRELSKRKDKLEPQEKAFLKEMGIWATYENRELLTKYFGISFEEEQSKQEAMTGRGSVSVKSDKTITVEDILTMDKISYLPLFSNSSKYFGEQRSKCIDIAPVHILMDMVFEILKTNPQVREAGFFKNFPITKEVYASQSKFYRIRNKGAEGQPTFNKRIGDHIIGKVTDSDSLIYKSINTRVTLIFTFFNTLQTLQKKIEKKENVLGLNGELINKLKNELKRFDVAQYQIKFATEIDSLQRLILNTKLNIDQTQLANLTVEQNDLMLSLKLFTDNLSRDYIYDVKNLESSRLYLENKLIPKLTVLNSASFSSYKKIIVRLDTLSKYIRLRGLQGVFNRIDNDKKRTPEDTVHAKTEYFSVDNRRFFEYFKLYFEIVSVINNLDQIKSYDKTFKFLMDVTGTFGNEKTRQVASLITSAYDKYTVLNTEENKLTLDVESMAVDLFNRYGDNNSRMVGMYFSVGINYAYNFKKSEYVVQDVSMPSKFSFVSEKIGVLFKLIDNNRRYSFGKTLYKPIINNVHALGYLSGLLYQIDFLNSNDFFKSPIYGVGLGVTSFNGLDLNLTYAVPFETNFGNGLWSVGLDIKITEYLGALKKKKSNATN